MAVVIGVVGRLLPHPPNVTPILALSLVAGTVVRPRLIAFAIPLCALVASDLVLGIYDPRIMAAVYIGFILPVLAGPFLGRGRWIPRLAVCSLLGSSVFFLVSNTAVFAFSGAYPMNPAGLIACYSAALPFYVHSLVGDLLWCVTFVAFLRLFEVSALR